MPLQKERGAGTDRGERQGAGGESQQADGAAVQHQHRQILQPQPRQDVHNHCCQERHEERVPGLGALQNGEGDNEGIDEGDNQGGDEDRPQWFRGQVGPILGFLNVAFSITNTFL